MTQEQTLPPGVYQDGADFYDEDIGHIWSAPFKVTDHDMAAATRARTAFLTYYRQVQEWA